MLRFKTYERAHSIEKRKKGKSALNAKIDMLRIYKNLATRVKLMSVQRETPVDQGQAVKSGP